MTTIETERLLLRPPVPGDLDALAALGADPAVMRYIGSGATHSRDEAAQWLDQMLAQAAELPPGRPGWQAVTLKTDGSWVGLAALKQLAAQHAETLAIDPPVEVGYRLARRHWGHGYATEAAGALVELAFDRLELPLLCAIADTRNVASKRVLEKIGLAWRQTYALDGRSIHFYGVGREEFRRLRDEG